MHTHLVAGQLISRQYFNRQAYITSLPANMQPNNIQLHSTGSTSKPLVYPSADRFLMGKPFLPQPHEVGWVDTVLAYPFQVYAIEQQ